jgi:diguanylate cyclase (GGDEF)-like protein
VAPVAAGRPAHSRRYAAAVLAFVGAIAGLCAFGARAATPPEMIFAHLGSDEGLSQGTIMAIVQDAQGFLWFGTEDGLDRFDGYEIRHFIHERNDPDTLPTNWIAALARDASGRLWVGSDGGGLVWRDAMLGRFRPPLLNTGQTPIRSEERIRALHIDHSGNIWVATHDAGVIVLDPAGHTLRRFRHDSAANSQDSGDTSLSDDSVFSFAEDSSGKIWIGTATGLDRLDPETGRVESYGNRLRAAGIPGDAALKVNALLVDARGTLWIGLDTALARYDTLTGVFTLRRHRDGDPSALPDGRVAALLEDDEQRLWVGTSAGLALLDRRSDEFVVFRHDQANRDSLPDNNIVSLYQDRSGLLWVGTKTGGVGRWNPRSWTFGHHRFGDEGSQSTTSFAVDHHGTLWVGSFGAGVASIDAQSGAITRYRHGSDSPLALRDDTVMALVTDDRNRVWLGTMSAGIERLDPARGEITHFESVPNEPSTLPAPGIMSLMRDTRGRIWVGSYGGGLARIDPDSDRVTRYPHGREQANGLSGDRATALAEDRAGLIWIGTDGGGLNVLDPVSGHFAHFVHDAKDPASLAANTVYALNVDDQGTVWVGTRGGGLDRAVGAPFGPKPMRFENLSESEGLPNSTVYGIESDSVGRLWVSTNRGLAAIRTDDRSVRAFRRSHGLQADEFNFGAHYRAPDGMLYFGGTNGYNAFLPERLRFNDKPPPVVLTDVLKLNKPVSRTPEMLSELDVGFRDAAVTFQFAALDFTGPAENRYSYRLEGFDSDWVNADGGRQATYTNLDGGNYVFQVRAANSDGRWSETPLSLRVHVSPPPWATWWARTLYAAAVVAIVFLVWYGQHRRVLREAAYAHRLKAEVDARTLELAERNRDMEKVNLQLREASVSDSLTGLGNRRFLHDWMAAQARAAAAAQPERCVLMVVDLDFLKPINDQYGHEGGDAVLIQFAEILRRVFRSEDRIVRWGGDEFVVMCMHADLALASVLAERVRASVAKQIFRVGNRVVARTSCSIGFATVPFIATHPHLVGWEQSLSFADAALYEAKRQRNTWLGWSGTDKAAELPSLAAALAADHAALEADGYLIVQRRPWSPQDTVDELRAPQLPRPG